MSGFAAWVQGPGGTGIIALSLFTLGLLLGGWGGFRWGERSGYLDAEEDAERAEARARRTHPVFQQLPADEPVLYEKRRPRDARQDPDLIGKILRPPEVAHEWRPDQLLNARSGPDITGPLVDWELVLEPSAVLGPDTDLSWTGEMNLRLAQFSEDMERLIGGTDVQLREITR